MRIVLLVFGDYPEVSASARRLHLVARGLAARGHEVDVVIPQRFRPGPLRLEIDGVHVHWGAITAPGSWNTLSARLAARRAALRLVAHLAAGGVDWLVLSNPSLDGLPLLAAARRRGAKVAATYDDLRDRPKHPTAEDRLRLLWLNLADSVVPRLAQCNVAISSYLAARVRSTAPRTPTVILPPVVDLDLFERQPVRAASFRAKWGLGEATLISYLGTYWYVDGVSVLLRAVKRLAQAGERFRVAISGAAHEGLDCDDVPRLVRELGLQDVVVQTGWLPTEDVVAAMSAADILVVPKLDHIANAAGVPTKLAEYLAIGRAVVASRVGDIPLYVKDHEDALLCPPGDAEALADALTQLIRDLPLRQRLAARARAAAQAHFDYREATRALETALLKVPDQRLARSQGSG